MGTRICPTIRDEDKVLTRSFAPILRLTQGSRPQRVLTCGDATRLSAKSHRQNCFAPTNTPTAKTLPAFLSACPHPRWSVLNQFLVRLSCYYISQSERGEFAPLSAVLFCSAPPLGCGFHSRLGRQTANNGTSWRLICASRARSRTDVRLDCASRACSPPICTILRRLIKLVCALLRFRERPRTIEVQRTTSSPQNPRKSLAQYSVVLFI